MPIVISGDDNTLRTRIFETARTIAWPERLAGCAIRNRLTDTWRGRDEEQWAEGESERERLIAALGSSEIDAVVTFAGEGIDLIFDLWAPVRWIGGWSTKRSTRLPMFSPGVSSRA